MKKLFRALWTTIKVSLFLVGAASVAMTIIVIAVVIGLSGMKTKIADKSVLVFDLSTRITDRPTDESSHLLSALLGSGESTVQLRAVTTALRAAATDPRISGLYLRGEPESDGYSSGFAALKEVRAAIQDFQKGGKPVIAYAAEADNRGYYLLSAADQILLNPLGELAFRGLATEETFYKGAADKYGVEFTPIRHGRYKSALEPFIREDLSPENREQLDALLRAVWGDVAAGVAESRKLEPDALSALVNKAGVITPEAAQAAGLVTELAYEGQALDKLRALAGKTPQDLDFPQVDIATYAQETARHATLKTVGRDKIALVYAEGVIVDGKGRAMDEDLIAGDRFARMLRELRHDDEVKAMVLRINSPGGSALASEVILDELRRFKETRPIVVSMGTVAASGGYFIATAANKIIAEPSTITGSIGVFGLSVNVKKIANDHGITFDGVKTGELADLGTISRPMTEPERTLMQGLVDRVYDAFVAHVATNRSMTASQVDALAQGRIWSGADALKVGLVDELGGLDAALAAAAKEAKLGADYAVEEYPLKKELLEQLAEAFMGDGSEPLARARAGLAGRLSARVAREWRFLSQFDDRLGVYVRLPCDLALE